MAITEQTLEQAITALRGFGARRVLLFGSCIHDPIHARDIDLAVEGIPIQKIWRANGALAEALDMPFDLVAREETPEFYALISKDARILYEQTSDT